MLICVQIALLSVQYGAQQQPGKTPAERRCLQPAAAQQPVCCLSAPMHIAAAAFANSQRLGFIVSAYSAVCPTVGPKRASRHAGAAAACMQWLPGPLCAARVAGLKLLAVVPRAHANINKWMWKHRFWNGNIAFCNIPVSAVDRLFRFEQVSRGTLTSQACDVRVLNMATTHASCSLEFNMSNLLGPVAIIALYGSVPNLRCPCHVYCDLWIRQCVVCSRESSSSLERRCGSSLAALQQDSCSPSGGLCNCSNCQQQQRCLNALRRLCKGSRVFPLGAVRGPSSPLYPSRTASTCWGRHQGFLGCS